MQKFCDHEWRVDMGYIQPEDVLYVAVHEPVHCGRCLIEFEKAEVAAASR